MLDIVEDVQEKESGTPLGFKESRREDMAARNYNTKRKAWMLRGELRNTRERYHRET